MESKIYPNFFSMNWTDLLQGLKEATSTENFDNISDDKYYKWLSWSHTKISEYIKAKVDSKFFLGITQANIVAGQTLYDDIWEDATTWRMINVIGSVFVKYNWTKFTKVEIRDLEEMPESREYYQENQSTEDPFCVITGQKILLFPTPKLDVVNGLEITWSKDVPDIDATSTSWDIFNWVLAEYHDMIIKGAEQYVYKFLQEFNKESKVREEFMYQDLPRMKTEISYRWSQPVEYKEDPAVINSLCN